MPTTLSSRSRNALTAGIATLALCGVAAAPLAAESAVIVPQPARSTSASVYAPATDLAQFRPARDRTDHQIDYSYLDEALSWFVIPMGPSIREGAPRVEPRLGTRRIYGHESRMRLEGNRVAFSYFTDDIRASLTEYRQDLERVGSTLDITRLPRNEQLAFWLNLHNVALIEALAYKYPLTQPSEGAFGSNEAPLQDARLVTVNGVALSPRDIRERIVYPNWSDPKVIYGFWRGEIGGPSIQRLAYSDSNLDMLLALSAEEFVNSLRGVENTGKTLRVSEIYREAAPFFFESAEQLRSHLASYARDDTKAILSKTTDTIYSRYEHDIADLARGENDPSLQNLWVNTDLLIGGDSPVPTRPNAAIQRLMEERRQKLNRAWRRGIRTGQVIVAGQEGVPKEIE